MKIDLHIHTIWSDGEITPQEVALWYSPMTAYAITDHNSLAGVLNLVEKKCLLPKNLLPGFETRLRGCPDYLLYFPRASVEQLREIESECYQLRSAADQVAQYVYEKKFGFNDFEKEREAVCRSLNRPEFLCTSLELGVMLNRKGLVSETKSSELARRATGQVMDETSKGSVPELFHAVKTVAPHDFDPQWLTKFIRRHNAEVALAHPLKEAVRKRKTKISECKEIEEILEKFFDEFEKSVENGAVEMPAHTDEWIQKHFDASLCELVAIVEKVAARRSLSVVVGSDMHILGTMIELADISAFRFPNWLNGWIEQQSRKNS